MAMGYPTSSTTKVIWIAGNGKLTITVIYVSPGEQPSDVAKEILGAAVEDANRSVIPALNSTITSVEGRSDDVTTDFTYEERLGVGEADVTLRVIVEVPGLRITSLFLVRILGQIINGHAFKETWKLLDPEDYTLQLNGHTEETDR